MTQPTPAESVTRPVAETARQGNSGPEVRLDAQRPMEHVARLYAVSAALSGALAPDEVAAVVVEEGLTALDAQAGSVAVLDERGTGLDVLATAGYSAAIARAFQRIPLDERFPLADAVRSGEPVWLQSYAERDARYPHLAELRRANGVGAMAAIPLVARGQTIGAMGLNFRDTQRFAESDRAFILALAQQCAQALDRARLYEAERAARAEAQRLQQRFAFLADAGALLIESLDYEATLRSVANLAVPRVADCCIVYISTEGDVLRRLEIAAVDPVTLNRLWELERRWPRMSYDADTMIARVIRSGEAVFIPEFTDADLPAIAADSEHAALVGTFGLTSMMVVPLPGHTRVFGALFLGTVTRRRYDDDDLALATELARRAGMAVEHALLYRGMARARHEAESANQTKADFLATMSHELRTPLNAIGGYVELLEMGLRGPITAAQREDLRRIDRNQRYLLGLINDVLNFARLESGPVPLSLADIPLDATLAGLEALIGPQMRAKGVAYGYRPGDPNVLVRADRERLEQIVLNLLTNAVKFTEPGGAVELSWERGERMALIRVRDTGCGIPEDKLQLIFDPFVQLGQGYRRTTDGIGLGLSISRNLARAMSGDLTAASVEGAGSVFTLALPMG